MGLYGKLDANIGLLPDMSYLTNKEMQLHIVCATPKPAKCMEIIARTPVRETRVGTLINNHLRDCCTPGGLKSACVV